MKILLLEDDHYYLSLLNDAISHHIENAEIYAYEKISDAVNSLLNYQLGIIDIQLPDGDGVDFVHAYNSNIENVIYVTSMNNRVYDAFGKNVISFIPKENLSLLLPSKLEEFNRSYKKDIMFLSTEKGIVKVNRNDVIYIQTDGRKLKIYTLRYCITTKRQPLKDFYLSLSSNFVWINQSTIINLDYVTMWNKDEITLYNTYKLYASRKYEKEAMHSFMVRNTL